MPKVRQDMEMIDANEERRNEAIRAMNIFEKMLHIQSEIPTVAKNLNVDTGKNKSYKAVSERDVKDAVKPLEEKYGVYSYPITKELMEQTFIETETQYGKRKSFYIREKVTYRFVNVHKPEEFIEIDGYGDGIDTGDKAPGKSDTYASKYCLMSAYKISTGDDPDKDASQEYSSKEINVANLAVRHTTAVANLRKVGVDTHDETVIAYVKEKAGVTTTEAGALLANPTDMAKVVAVYEEIYKAKR